MLSVFIKNFGCRVNQAEAFAWAETLQAGGLQLADDWRAADVVIVNSCTLTGRADRDVNRFLRRVTRERPGVRIAITGCAAQILPPDIRGSAQVILSLPNCEKEQLAVRLLALTKRNGWADCRSYDPFRNAIGESPFPRSGDGSGHRERPEGAWRSHGGETEEGRLDGEEAHPYRARAYLKIQDGCDNRCTFCVIPSVRGGCRSVPVDDVVARVEKLTDDGFREIVLAGIHLSSYGQVLEAAPAKAANSHRQGDITLTDLLQRIEEVPGLGRLRLSSLDPRKIDDAFIAQVGGNPRICQHFHLSLQHASLPILRRMGRLGHPGGHAAGDEADDDGLRVRGAARSKEAIPPPFEGLISRFRALSPSAAIGADVIVGFPGEKDEDFAVLEAFLERSPLSYFHVFSYSPRRGTPAAGWTQVPEAVKSARARRLRRLSAAKNLAFRRSFVGKELDAIVIAAPGEPRISTDEVIATALAGGDLECRGDRHAELLTGNYISVAVPNCPASRRDLVRVRITRVLPDRTEGQLVWIPSSTRPAA